MMRMSIRAGLFGIALAVGGCEALIPVSDAIRHWERPFTISTNVRGRVTLTDFVTPIGGVLNRVRKYEFERFDPVTGRWYPAELNHDGDYVFTSESLAAIAEATARREASSGAATPASGPEVGRTGTPPMAPAGAKPKAMTGEDMERHSKMNPEPFEEPMLPE